MWRNSVWTVSGIEKNNLFTAAADVLTCRRVTVTGVTNNINDDCISVTCAGSRVPLAHWNNLLGHLIQPEASLMWLVSPVAPGMAVTLVHWCFSTSWHFVHTLCERWCSLYFFQWALCLVLIKANVTVTTCPPKMANVAYEHVERMHHCGCSLVLLDVSVFLLHAPPTTSVCL